MEKKLDGGFSFHNEKQEQLFSDKFYKERTKCLERMLSDMEARNTGFKIQIVLFTVLKFCSFKDGEVRIIDNYSLENKLREKFKANKQSYERDVKPILKVRVIGVNLKDSQMKFCNYSLFLIKLNLDCFYKFNIQFSQRVF